MNKKSLKKALEGKKIQDSVNCEKLMEVLKSLGFKIDSKKPASFYLIDGDSAISVSAVIFKNLNNDEVSAEDLYANYEESMIQYEEGEILTADRGDDHFSFIYLGEHTDGTLLGFGMCSNGLGNGTLRYTKKRCRKATDEEKTIFVNICKDQGINVEYIDGKIDIFKLRAYGQKYFSVFVNFKTGDIDVKEFVEEHDLTDDNSFDTGNYFRSESEARQAYSTIK
jgi:hypothetical protein